MSKYTVGIDIGGTNTKFGVVDIHGNILQQDRIHTHEPETVTDFIDELYAKLKPDDRGTWRPG